MGILFKTYNRKHQLHLYNELWVLHTKNELQEILSLFPAQEATKAAITPVGEKMEVQLNGLILNCRDIVDLKKKFGMLVDLKERYQKIVPVKKRG